MCDLAREVFFESPGRSIYFLLAVGCPKKLLLFDSSPKSYLDADIQVSLYGKKIKDLIIFPEIADVLVFP